jgi:transcriptional regulator with XRE-family HTH domain
MNTMSSAVNVVGQLPAEENKFFEWQFSLSRRLCQIMEERKISQTEFAKLVGITEEELDDLIHFCADPPLSLMARIAALSNAELLSWVNTDVVE